MVDWLHGFLGSSVVARLFLVIAVGYVVGEVTFPGKFRLGIAAVLFIGMGIGAWDPAFTVPESITTLGLAVFVYCVGLETAAGFFRTMRSRGLVTILCTVVGLLAGTVVAWLFIHFLHKPRELIVGIYCGALNNAPALATVTEALHRRGASPQEIALTVVGCGLAYPITVVTLLLKIQFLFSRNSATPATHEASAGTKWIPPVILIVEPLRDGEAPWTCGEVHRKTGVVLSRIRRPDGTWSLLREGDGLTAGSEVVAIGSEAQVEAAGRLLGRRSAESVDYTGVESHRYFLSNPRLAGKTVGSLQLQNIGAVVTRIRRGDVNIPVREGTILQLGDRLRVVSYQDTEAEVRKLLGNSLQVLGETGYLTFAIGIILGLILGSIPIPIPGLETPLRLGAAGGPLVMALVLGALGRTGAFVWNLPYSSNQTLKLFGLLLFLAALGLQAGGHVLPALQADGWFIAGLAVLIGLATHLAFWAMLRLFGIGDPAVVSGQSAALQTMPAALAFACKKAGSNLEVTTAYATIFPFAMIGKILLAQLLLLL